jgi:hypothetical protein
MKLIVILALLALAATSPLLATITPYLPHDDTDGILKCIFDRDNATRSINSAKTFCGPETQTNYKCYSSYASFKLCLINNECQNKFDEQEVAMRGFRLAWIAGIVGST